MSNIKKLKPLSEWLEFELERPPVWLDGSTVKFRVRPVTGLSGLNVAPNDLVLSSIYAEVVIDAIQEWGFLDDGKPIPCNSETKQEYAGNLRELLGLKLKGKPGLLGIELAGYAATTENFLKN